MMFCLGIFLAIIQGTVPANAEVIVVPVSLTFQASLGASTPQKLTFVGKELTRPVMYRMLPLNGEAGTLPAANFKIKTPFTNGFQRLDRFQTVLSPGGDDQVTASLSVEVDWNNPPGTYSGSMISDSGEREVPIQVTVLPKSIVTLNPAKFDLVPSDLNSPIVTRVEVFLASNSKHWHVFCVSESLKKQGGTEEIDTSRVYVRLVSTGNSVPWKKLDRPFKVAQGGPGPNRKVATLELVFQSRREDPPGRYEGTFKFMISNAP